MNVNENERFLQRKEVNIKRCSFQTPIKSVCFVTDTLSLSRHSDCHGNDALFFLTQSEKREKAHRMCTTQFLRCVKITNDIKQRTYTNIYTYLCSDSYITSVLEYAKINVPFEG